MPDAFRDLVDAVSFVLLAPFARRFHVPGGAKVFVVRARLFPFERLDSLRLFVADLLVAVTEVRPHCPFLGQLQSQAASDRLNSRSAFHRLPAVPADRPFASSLWPMLSRWMVVTLATRSGWISR